MPRCSECKFLEDEQSRWWLPGSSGECLLCMGEMAVGLGGKWVPKNEVDMPRDCKDYIPLKVSVSSEMGLLLEMQKDLMDKVPHDLSPQVVSQITAGLGVMEEVHEYLNSIGRKPWRPNPLPRENQLEELVDILFYYLELILLSGFSWEEITTEYKRKHAENLERYRKGAGGDYSWDHRATKGEL